ncbi:MAG: glutathione S-transferase [Pseudomonadota bacterium]
MRYVLAIGDRSYSSWSLRAWLLFAGFDIPATVERAFMGTQAFPQMLSRFGAARTVPAMRGGDVVCWDSLAILDTLAEAHPGAGLWPQAPADRALARSLVAEMHSGFSALRNVCPMNLRTAFTGFVPDDDVLADLTRLETLWSLARGTGRDGPWLFGAYGAADAFFAPVAARIAGYGLPLAAHQPYVAAHLAHAPFRQWRAMGIAEAYEQIRYRNALTPASWPGPIPRPAQVVGAGTAENTVCPFSGDPVAADALLRMDGRIIGFCNSFCRDKVAADPEAWPRAMALLQR